MKTVSEKSRLFAASRLASSRLASSRLASSRLASSRLAVSRLAPSWLVPLRLARSRCGAVLFCVAAAVCAVTLGPARAWAQAPGETSAAPPNCDRACLIDFADRYMQALVKQDPEGLPWADVVEFTENNVSMMIGDAIWGTISSITSSPVYAADPRSGNVVWFGVVEEHGQAAYYGMRLKIEDHMIAEVETIVSREGNPGPFSDPTNYEMDSVYTEILPEDQRRPRQRMVALVDGYFSTKQLNDGTLLTQFDPDCERVVNGVSTTHGEYWAAKVAQGCQAQFELGLYKPVDHIRERHYPVVDVERGVVVATALVDRAARYVEYTSTDGRPLEIQIKYSYSRGLMQIFKIRDGEIYRVDAVSAFLPYFMPTPWAE